MSRGRSLRRPYAVPERHVESGDSHLLDGRNVRSGEPSRLGHDGVGLDLAVAHERQRVGGQIAHEIDVTRHQILAGGRTAAVGHELEARAGILLQIESAKMRPASDADGCGRGLVGIGLQPGNHVFHVVSRKRLPGHDPKRAGGDVGYRLEVVEQIECQRVHGAGADVTCPVAEAERVSVSCGACGAAGADAAAGAGHVLDDDRLAERALHVIDRAFAQECRLRRPPGMG